MDSYLFRKICSGKYKMEINGKIAYMKKTFSIEEEKYTMKFYSNRFFLFPEFTVTEIAKYRINVKGGFWFFFIWQGFIFYENIKLISKL